MTLAKTHILIVGGTRGIGRATATAALAAGARVTVTGRSAASLSARPDGATGVVLDFTDAASVAALAECIGSVDHLVLSASDAVAWGPFAEVAEDALRAAFDAKFWGYWRVIRALAPQLSAAGSVTLVTGAAARAALPGTSGLAAVNGALEAMARVLAVELAPRRVNTVSPGMTATEAYAGMPEAAREGMFAATAGTSPSTGWPVGFWWAELTHTWWTFTEAGYEIEIVSPKGGDLAADGLSDLEDASGHSAHDLISLGSKKSAKHAALLVIPPFLTGRHDVAPPPDPV